MRPGFGQLSGSILGTFGSFPFLLFSQERESLGRVRRENSRCPIVFGPSGERNREPQSQGSEERKERRNAGIDFDRGINQGTLIKVPRGCWRFRHCRYDPSAVSRRCVGRPPLRPSAVLFHSHRIDLFRLGQRPLTSPCRLNFPNNRVLHVGPGRVSPPNAVIAIAISSGPVVGFSRRGSLPSRERDPPSEPPARRFRGKLVALEDRSGGGNSRRRRRSGHLLTVRKSIEAFDLDTATTEVLSAGGHRPRGGGHLVEQVGRRFARRTDRGAEPRSRKVTWRSPDLSDDTTVAHAAIRAIRRTAADARTRRVHEEAVHPEPSPPRPSRAVRRSRSATAPGSTLPDDGKPSRVVDVCLARRKTTTGDGHLAHRAGRFGLAQVEMPPVACLALRRSNRGNASNSRLVCSPRDPEVLA